MNIYYKFFLIQFPLRLSALDIIPFCIAGFIDARFDQNGIQIDQWI